MNAIVNNIIVRYIKAYIKQHQLFEVNLFVGEISLKNAFLDAIKITSLFQQFNPHISCNLGKVGSLKVEIPWTTISKESVYVTLEDCYFKLTMLYNEQEKQVPVEKIANLVLGDDISEKEQSNTLINNIIQNLKVEVKNLQIEIDIGPELTSSITAERIFYGPLRDNPDKDLLSKIIDISGLQLLLYITKARSRTAFISSTMSKVSLAMKLYPEIHEYVVTVKEQCEVNMYIESIQKLFYLQNYIHRGFLKHYEINVMTFISILKEKNFIHKISINFENFLVNVSSVEMANAVQLSLKGVAFKMEYYEHISQMMYSFDMQSLGLMHNGSYLMLLTPINPQNNNLIRKFRTFETQLQSSENYHVKVIMQFEDRQKTKITKIQMFQYGWEVVLYVDNLLKNLEKLRKFILDLISQLNQERKESAAAREEPSVGQINTKTKQQLNLLFAQNLIKLDTEKDLPRLKNLFPMKLYISLSIDANIKSRAALYFMGSEIKIHQLFGEDAIATPILDLRDTTMELRYDVAKNSLHSILSSEGLTCRVTSDFIHQIITAAQILPNYLSKLKPEPVEESSSPSNNDLSEPLLQPQSQFNPYLKASFKFINIVFGETCHIGSTVQAQSSIFREFLVMKIKNMNVESSHRFQRLHLKNQISCKFFPANSEKSQQVFKKWPFHIEFDLSSLNINLETADRIEITLTPDILQYIQAFASNSFLYGNYIINYLSRPVIVKTEKLNGRERNFCLLPKQMYSIPVFHEKGQEALNMYQFEVPFEQDSLGSDLINLHEIVQSSYNLQLDLHSERSNIRGIINCSLGTMREGSKEIPSVFLTGAGYFVNLLNTQFKISYPTLLSENRELCLKSLAESCMNLEDVQEWIKNDNFSELFDICECIMEQIGHLDEKKMILTNLKTMNYYTSSRKIIGGNTIQFFDVNNEECPVLQIIKKPLVSSNLYILKTLLLIDNRLDISLNINFNKSGSFKLEITPTTREFVVPAEDFTIFAYKVQFAVSFNYLGVNYESGAEEIAGYSYTEAFLQEKPRKSRAINLRIAEEEVNTKSFLQVLLVRFYEEESLICEIKHPMKIDNKTEWFFELIYETTTYKDTLEPYKNNNSFHSFGPEKKFQIKIAHSKNLLDDRSPLILVDLGKLKETGSCVLSFNFVAKGDNYYQVPLFLSYKGSEQDLLTISPLVTVSNHMERRIALGGFSLESGMTSTPFYFSVSIDPNLNNQAHFFASVDASLNIKSPGDSIFQKALADMKPTLKLFNRNNQSIAFEKSLIDCLKNYFTQTEYDDNDINSEVISFEVQKRETDNLISILCVEGYSDLLPSYLSYKNFCNRSFTLSVTSKSGKKLFPMQTLHQDVLMIPFKLEKPSIEIQFSSKSALKISPEKKQKVQQYRKDGMEFQVTHYIENGIVNLELRCQEESEENLETPILLSREGTISINDFALNINFYLDLAIQDHVEVYLDLKGTSLSQEHFQIELKKFMVNSCLSQNWKVQELFDQNISLSAGLALDYKFQDNLAILSNIKLDVFPMKIAISDTLFQFLSNFLLKAKRETTSPKEIIQTSPYLSPENNDISKNISSVAIPSQPIKKFLLSFEELVIPSFEISLDLDLKDLIKVSHTLTLEAFTIKDLKNLSVPAVQGVPQRYNPNQPVWDLYCLYYLKMKVVENFDEEIMLLMKCRLVKEKANFPEKKCFLAVSSRYLYIFQYNEIIEYYPIKKIETLSFNKKKEQLEIRLFREESVFLKTNK